MGLVGFHDIPAIGSYLMPNPVYTYIFNIRFNYYVKIRVYEIYEN